MDKTEFKNLTTKIYEEYGFVKKGKYYYLNIKDVLICSGVLNTYNYSFLAYNISLKAIHSDQEYKNNMFDGFDCHAIDMYYTPNADGYLKKALYYEKYSAEEYCKRLPKILKKYFDPFKENAIEHIKKCYKTVGLVIEKDIIMLSKAAREYLEL